MSNVTETCEIDVPSLVDFFLQTWSFEKQNSAKLQLQKEFGLEYSDGECEKAIVSDKESEINSTNAYISIEEYEMFAEKFKAREHFEVTLSHKMFIQKAYKRFLHYLDLHNLRNDMIDAHDNSKLTSFLEIVGYTQRWIWNVKSDIWGQALHHHFTSNSHHPEYYSKKNGKNGETVQNDMHHLDLLESVVDMIACRWERKLGGKEDVTNDQLVDIEPIFLKRYTMNDRAKVLHILHDLKNDVTTN